MVITYFFFLLQLLIFNLVSSVSSQQLYFLGCLASSKEGVMVSDLLTLFSVTQILLWRNVTHEAYPSNIYAHLQDRIFRGLNSQYSSVSISCSFSSYGTYFFVSALVWFNLSFCWLEPLNISARCSENLIYLFWAPIKIAMVIFDSVLLKLLLDHYHA